MDTARGERGDEATEGRVRAEQIRLIARYTGAVMVANVWNACIVVSVMSSDPRRYLAVVWAAIVCVAAGLVILRRLRSPGLMVRKSVSSRGITRARVYAGISGFLWGLVPAAFFGASSHTSQLVITCIVAGMMGGGTFALASIPSAAAIFCGLVFTGSLIGLWSSGSPVALPITIMMVAFFAVLLRGAYVYASQLRSKVLEQVAIERSARMDTLTRLPNRAAFIDEAEAAVERHRRTKETFALLYLDFDGFKEINDTHGHRTGDRLLIEFARRLEKSVRAFDTVARLGGDEFVVLLANVERPAEIAAAAERLLSALNAPVEVDGSTFACRASIGIAVTGDGAETLDHLLDRADVALYRAKAAGRNRFCFFDQKLDECARDRKAMKEALRLALADHQLHLEFQPVMDTATNEIREFEALVRWKHPVKGIISPGNFIPVAEESGEIHAIGYWIVEQACLALSQWPGNMRLAINVSAVQFRDPMFAHDLAEALAAHGVARGRLDVEITESTALAHCATTQANLKALKAAGIGVLIDDFGTGYSTLTALQRLECTGIKIDRSFVNDVNTNRVSSAIVKSIIQLGRSLDLEVIAEGVETLDQLLFLKDANCPAVQGYLLSRPVDGQSAVRLAKIQAGLIDVQAPMSAAA